MSWGKRGGRAAPVKETAVETDWGRIYILGLSVYFPRWRKVFGPEGGLSSYLVIDLEGQILAFSRVPHG